MIRSPPRFPFPGRDQRTLRTPPEPGTTSPASGFCIKNCCKSEYSSSSSYAGSTRSKMDDSMNVNTLGLYASGVQKARPKSLRGLECTGVGRTLNVLTEQGAGLAEVLERKSEGNHVIELRWACSAWRVHHLVRWLPLPHTFTAPARESARCGLSVAHDRPVVGLWHPSPSCLLPSSTA